MPPRIALDSVIDAISLCVEHQRRTSARCLRNGPADLTEQDTTTIRRSYVRQHEDHCYPAHRLR